MRNNIAIWVTLLAATPAWADSRTLNWNELSAFVENRTMSVGLPDGARL